MPLPTKIGGLSGPFRNRPEYENAFELFWFSSSIPMKSSECINFIFSALLLIFSVIYLSAVIAAKLDLSLLALICLATPFISFCSSLLNMALNYSFFYSLFWISSCFIILFVFLVDDVCFIRFSIAAFTCWLMSSVIFWTCTSSSAVSGSWG